MYARVTHAQIQPDHQDAMLQEVEESVFPALEQLPGFSGYFLLVDPETGDGLNIALWRSEDDMAESKASGFYQEQVAKVAVWLAAPPEMAKYQVAIQT